MPMYVYGGWSSSFFQRGYYTEESLHLLEGKNALCRGNIEEFIDYTER
jgi:hypothetical protein